MKISRVLLLILVSLHLSFLKVSGVTISGTINSHDPATLIKDGNTYWQFTTGQGIWSSISDNLSYWSASNKPVFATGSWPTWINNYVSGFAGDFWAPDIIYMDSAYYIYYSCSKWGTTNSAIGVAKSKSLNKPAWTDLGMVVYSNGSNTAINAIDPGIFRDDDGKIYMVYGSWFGGIGIVDIDSVSGLATSSVTHLYGGSHQSIEAPYLFKEDSSYYLVVNRGTCCDGVNSTYYITVGKSDSVKGPYTDFRNLLTKSGRYIGPGHFGLMREVCGNYVSIHYYDGADNGSPKLDILKMYMSNGWPTLTRSFSFQDCDTVKVSGVSENFDRNSGITFFPNPSSNGIFSVEIDRNQWVSQLQVDIFSCDGKKVYSREFEPTNMLEIQTGLSRGIYVVQVRSGSKIYSGKVSVN